MCRNLILLLLFVSLQSLSARKRDPIWVGGGVGASFPSNIGNDAQTLGFATVAVPGFRIEADARWFYAQRLSLSADLSWSAFGQKDDFWDVRNNGSVKAHYSFVSGLVKGHYYFSDDAFRPYAGIGFGVAWLSNRMDYQSTLSGTLADNSVGYVNSQFKPIYAPEIGFLIETSKKSFFYTTFSYTLIPNMTAEYVSVKDQYGWDADVIVQNPHGNQNHFSLTVGMLFRWD